MDTFFLLLMLWFYSLIPAVAFSLPAWVFGRRRTTWQWLDFSVLFLPYTIWAALLVLNLRPKSLANLGAEAIYLGCAITLAAFIRVGIGQRVRPARSALLVLLLICCLSFAIYWFVPILAE